MAHETKYDGIVFELAGNEYVLPPLSLIKMPKIKHLMEGGEMTEEFVAGLINAIYWSLQRNYPDIEHKLIEDSIDLTNWKRVFSSFMEANGFVSSDEEQPLGEAQAAASQA